jgi:hypothetical protein
LEFEPQRRLNGENILFFDELKTFGEAICGFNEEGGLQSRFSNLGEGISKKIEKGISGRGDQES